MPIVVKAEKDDTVSTVIRKFKKKVQLEQLLAEIKEKEFYKKPSVLKKEKKAEIERRKKRPRDRV